jgi:hypothetical protein
MQKTQMTQICVTGLQCVNKVGVDTLKSDINGTDDLMYEAVTK